jgi:hypothetical protein
VSGAFHPGAGTIIAKNSFLGFFQTNGAADSFSEAVTVSVTLTSGALSVACSNGLLGKVTVYNNLAIPGFVPISPAQMAFTATDGSGAHEDCWLDNVDLTSQRRPSCSRPRTGPPQIVQQTGNVTVSAGADLHGRSDGTVAFYLPVVVQRRADRGATAANGDPADDEFRLHEFGRDHGHFDHPCRLPPR